MLYVKKRSLSLVTAIALVLAMFALLPDGALKANALSFKNGVLTLSGNVNLSEVQGYSSTAVKVVADSSAVMPADCTEMFQAWDYLTEIDLSKANFTNVKSMNHMFSDNYELKKVNLSGIQTPNLENVGELFIYDNVLEELDLSTMNFSKVSKMNHLFKECFALKTLKLGNISTGSATSMVGLFRDCRSLTTLDLSTFNTSKVSDMSEMFYNCFNLQTIYGPAEWSLAGLRNHDVTNNTMEMFYGCSALVGGNGTTYNSYNINGNYAHIDKPGNPGYFTQGTGSTETQYQLEINGKYVTPSNASNVLGDNKFVYDNANKLLTVKGGTYANGSIVNHGIKDLKIKFDGNTSLFNIHMNESTVITGTGKVTLGGGISFAASNNSAEFKLEIKDADIEINGVTGITGTGDNVKKESLAISRSNIKINSTNGAVKGFYQGITLSNCYLITPAGGAVSNGAITQGGTVAANVVISTTQVQQRLLGDMNGDGRVTADDAIIAARFSAGYGNYKNMYNVKVGDMNKDGLITADDAIIIARVAAGYGSYKTQYNEYVTL